MNTTITSTQVSSTTTFAQQMFVVEQHFEQNRRSGSKPQTAGSVEQR
jgi:hypothetical protein